MEKICIILCSIWNKRESMLWNRIPFQTQETVRIGLSQMARSEAKIICCSIPNLVQVEVKPIKM